MTATALIIDDEPDIRELITMTLTRMGLDCHAAANLEEARQLLNTYHFDVCLSDMRLPDGNGVEFVRYIQSKEPELPVAVITAHGNMEAAVEAMKNGAYDFVSKPVDIQQLRQLVVQAIALNNTDIKKPASNDPQFDSSVVQEPGESASLRAERVDFAGKNPQSTDVSIADGLSPAKPATSLLELSHRVQADKEQQAKNDGSDKLLGSSSVMQSLRQMIAKVSRTNAPIWITGESGTGKELIARLIHESGPRSGNAFVAINCGAIPSELMESELFGHLKGSFTGATADKKGLFQLADGGTLFLDEVAELPLHMQVKLLRAIQERSIRPVGGSEETSVDARILSASHKDLAAEVDAGRFRHDLYYRLNVISLHAPSLRDRPEDIPELCKGILAKLQTQLGSTENMSMTDAAINALAGHQFPGNVRELENILERSIALAEGNRIEVADLNLPLESVTDTTSAAGSQKAHVENSEASRIVEALNTTRWNRKEAAKILGLTYRQLRYRIKQLGIDDKK